MLPLFYAVGTSGIILCLRFFLVVVTTWALHSECVPSHSFTCLTSVSDGILCFQYMLAFYILQHGHLLDSYLVEFLETFTLRQTFVDKDRIEVLHITQTNQLVNRCVVAYITLLIQSNAMG